MTDSDEAATNATLADWSRRLAAALELGDLDVDIDAVLGLAGSAARAVVRPAAPLTTFLVGYAAGLAAAGGTDTATAVDRAAGVARALAAERASSNPA